MKHKKKIIILFLMFAVLCLGILGKYTLFKQGVTYITTDVSIRDLEEKILANGILHAIKNVEVGAQVSGQLKKIHVLLGERVKAGQLLAEIDPTLQQNALQDAVAQVENLQAQKSSKEAIAKQYKLTYQRQLKMITKGASSQADLESAQAQFESTCADINALEAQIKKAKIAVATAQANLEYTKIFAPSDGEVVSIITEEGQTVVSTQTATIILKLADLDTMTVKAEISEADIMRIHHGQKVYFTTMNDPATRYYSKIRFIEPSPTTSNGNKPSNIGINGSVAVYYNSLFEVPNTEHKFKIAMTVQVFIILQEIKNALCVPTSVLGEQDENGYYMIRVLQNNIPKIRKVKIGIIDNIYAQVLSGLAINDKVILRDNIFTVPPDAITTSTSLKRG